MQHHDCEVHQTAFQIKVRESKCVLELMNCCAAYLLDCITKMDGCLMCIKYVSAPVISHFTSYYINTDLHALFYIFMGIMGHA